MMLRDAFIARFLPQQLETLAGRECEARRDNESTRARASTNRIHVLHDAMW